MPSMFRFRYLFKTRLSSKLLELLYIDEKLQYNVDGSMNRRV
jgi:hypothetical protein